MRLTARTILVLSLALPALPACSGAPDAEAVAVFGQVRAEDGSGIAGAQVCAAAKNACVTTDASGNYKLPYDSTIAEPVVVQFSRLGYARKVVRMHNAAISQAAVVIRAVDTQSQITVPATGAAAVTLEAVHDDSRSSLVIGANTLVDPNGVLAAGNANVSLTYFHPLQTLETAPAALNAEDGNAIKGLFTWGMADIEIEQNGALLQVAPGQTLGWNIFEPTTISSTLSPNATVSLPLPDLYSLNPNTGLWHLEGTVATGAVSYDANSTTIKTLLPHLSSWNVDSDAGPAFGGCVSGRIVDPCGAPIAGKAITVWFLGFEELKDWRGTVTSSSGTFCTPTYLSSWNVSGNNLNINYLVAGADSVGDTSMCNPAPATCFNCVDESPPFSTMGWCSNCLMDPSRSQPANAGTQAPTYYSNTCGAPSVNLVPHSSCGGGGCTASGDIVLNSTSCAKKVSANSATATTPPDPCTNGTGKKLGDACTTTDTCCPHALVCQDHLCLPPSDTTAN